MMRSSNVVYNLHLYHNPAADVRARPRRRAITAAEEQPFDRSRIAASLRGGRSRAGAGTSLIALWRADFSVAQAMAPAARSKAASDLSIACMMTASLRATATAARLKPIFSLSLRPQTRKLLSAWVRVR